MENRFLVAISASFPFTNTMYVYTTSFVRFSRFHKFSKEKRFLLLTLARYRFHGCLIVNPKRELESKSPLQDINPMYITQGNPLCFNFICLLLKNNAAPILLARALLIVMVPNVYYFKGWREQNWGRTFL